MPKKPFCSSFSVRQSLLANGQYVGRELVGQGLSDQRSAAEPRWASLRMKECLRHYQRSGTETAVDYEGRGELWSPARAGMTRPVGRWPCTWDMAQSPIAGQAHSGGRYGR